MTGSMLRRDARLAVRVCVVLLAAALLGCAGSGPAVNSSGGSQDGLARRDGFWLADLTPEERRELDARAAKVLPPQGYAALERLGMAPWAGDNAAGTARSASVALPYFQADATAPYAPGQGGWIAHSDDVVITPGPPQPSMDMAPPGTSFPDNFSYVIYRVDDCTPEPRSMSVQTALTLSEVGVAAYNWGYGSMGRWEPLFYGVPEGGVAQASLEITGADWTNGGGDMAFVVFCLSPATASVTSFQVSDVSTNKPPTARLAADTGGGIAPLTVNFDASLSSDDDGLIAKYRFDPEGDGNWIDNGTNPLFSYVYEFAGPHDIVLEVTDSGGLKGTEQSTIIVRTGLYNEQEPNDGLVEANVLPAFPISSYTGNCGPAGGNDGDDADWFTFDAQTDDVLSFLVHHSNLEGSHEFTAQLLDAEMSVLALSPGYPASLITYEVTGTESTPFYLRILNTAGHSDYIITGSKQSTGGYDETEKNDSPASADRLNDLADLGEMTDFNASLGDNPPEYEGYDGGMEDWFYFGGNEGAELDLTLTFDENFGDIGMTLLDFELEVLENVTDDNGDGVLELNYTFGPADQPKCFLHVEASSGYSDYAMDGTLTVPNPGFDEDENNDNAGDANALPGLPFSDPFTGNIGLGGSYDGDKVDYFTFSAAAGDKYDFTITPAQAGSLLTAYVTDSSGPPPRTIGGTFRDGLTGELTVSVLIREADVAPFILQLESLDSDIPTDYSITCAVADFSEEEENDDYDSANPLPSEAFQFFSGSLGSGGSDYDGDSIDIFSFSAEEGSKVSFSVFYEFATGTIGGTLRDSEDDEIGTWFDNGDHRITVETLEPIDADDVAPYYLELAPETGYIDYWISPGGP